MGEEATIEIKAVGIKKEDVEELISKLKTLLDNFNKFFQESFTSGGRLKVATIPIPVGITGEAMESLEKLPDILEQLIKEVQELREEMKKLRTVI